MPNVKVKKTSTLNLGQDIDKRRRDPENGKVWVKPDERYRAPKNLDRNYTALITYLGDDDSILVDQTYLRDLAELNEAIKEYKMILSINITVPYTHPGGQKE